MGIINKIPQIAQVNFFSATFPKKIHDGIKLIFNDRPETKLLEIKIAEEKLNIKAIKQYYIRARHDKGELIDRILKKMLDKTVIIFVNTKRFAEMINQILDSKGHQIAFITGDLKKEEREKLVQMFG